MKSDVAKRIESINKGIIPEGYKKTKVGIVPVEWEDTHFSELFIEKKNVTSDFEKYHLGCVAVLKNKISGENFFGKKFLRLHRSLVRTPFQKASICNR